MDKISEKKRWLNTSRVKIIIAIILILLFAYMLDFFFPVYQKQKTSEDFNSDLDLISQAIEKFHAKNGVIPEILIGGDSDGFTFFMDRKKLKIAPDPLIESGFLNSYPELHFSSPGSKRLFISFQMTERGNSYLFGLNGNKTCNLDLLESESYISLYKKDPGANPFGGCFKYEPVTGKPEYVLSILADVEKSQDKNDSLILVFNAIQCSYNDGRWNKVNYTVRSEI